ncbi:MAG: enoyl-CoA hydratase/isomerase family protein [Pseudomonadales bacterium]|nr:enoyl-CoA hydratase/isomerase family protein [Pseudomonadales bacterium]
MAKIRVEADGAVRTVTLTRGEKRNALDDEMLQALEAAFKEVPPAEERVTVIRAEGPVFCAGMDLKARKTSINGISVIEAMLHAIETYPLPVVGVVHGDAIAGGNELALHCDIVVARSTARFGMSLAQIGLAPTWFLAKKLLEVAGPVKTREFLFLGDPFPATQMHAMGLIARVAEPDDFESEVTKIVDRLTANAPLSLKAMKALLVREMCFRDGIYHKDVDQLVADASNSTDAQEGVKARLEKRKAEFLGR